MGSVVIAWFCIFCRLCYRDESLPPRIPVLSPCLEVGMIIWSSVESLPPRIPVLSPCLEVVVITHERQRHHEMDDYFARKFAPLHIMFVIGRPCKSDAECEPRVAFIRCLEGLVTWILFILILLLLLVCAVFFVRGPDSFVLAVSL